MEFQGFQGALGLIAIAAFAWSAFQFSTVKNLRDTNKDLRDERDDNKERLATKTLESETLKKEAAEKDGQIGVLKEINSGIVDWNVVVDLIVSHNRLAEEHWQREESRWARLDGDADA